MFIIREIRYIYKLLTNIDINVQTIYANFSRFIQLLMRKTIYFWSLLIIVYLVLSKPAFATFSKNSANPILDTLGHPTNPFLSIPALSVIRTSSDYKMWLSEYVDQKNQIGLATSTDGLNWTKYPVNPVLSPKLNDLWEQGVGGPSVVYTDNLYIMWLTSLNFTQIESFRISRATSPDGINWSPQEIIFTKSDVAWESEGVNSPSVLLVNNQYEMWYGARDSAGVWRIGYANSDDGISWNRHSTPVLQPSLPWEGTVVAAANVIRLDGMYHMYYHTGPLFLHFIGHATSVDGINWTKDPEPILNRGEFVDFDNDMIATPYAVRITNQLKMYYAGHDGANWRIGLAEELLPVPYYSQSNPLWADDVYDSTPNTMESLGCAVTSAAMVLRHFNVTQTPGNPLTGLPQKELTPGTLNEWLIDTKDGSFRNGATNFASIAAMTTKAHMLNPSSPKLDYSQGITLADIDDELNNDRAPILKLAYPPSLSGMHFVVATGSANSTYNILDPAFADRITLSPHYDTVLRVDKFKVTNSDFSYLIFVVDETVNLELLNSNNQPVGQVEFEAPIFDQISQNSNGETLKALYYKQPLAGNYLLKITSPNNASYQLDSYMYDQEGNGGQLPSNTGVISTTDTDLYEISSDPSSSENSSVQLKVTFETLKNDLKTSYELGWISNHNAYVALTAEASVAERLVEKNRKPLAQLMLKVMLGKLKLFKNKSVNPEAYELLKQDIDSLINQL